MSDQNPALPAALRGLASLPMQNRLGLILAIAAVVALISGSWMWSQVPEYRILYSGISDRDGGAVIAALDQINIPHRLSSSGAILVPEKHVHEARLKLATQGLPKGGIVGFDLMENQKFGTTQFQEQVNFQRGLEGELARTIQTLTAVAAARVHLAIPKQSVFLRDAQKPSASVVLSLHTGRTLDRSQIAGVIHLVSSSVPDLAPKMVSIIDQSGALLTGSGDSRNGNMLEPAQISYVSQIESNFSKRIQEILEPVVGRANVRAQVTADVDFSETESLAERYRPNQNQTESAIRSQQISEDSRNTSAGGAVGIPGALSNQPGSPVTAPISANSASKPPANATATISATASPVPSVKRDSTVNYEVDKTVQRTRSQTGSIRRLSAAVVINYRKVLEPAGVAGKDGVEANPEAPKAKQVPLSTEEMQQINALVRETIGFSQARGDSVNVVNVAFTSDETGEAAAELALWQKPENVALFKTLARDLAIAAIALSVFLFVLRPLLRQLAAGAPIPLIEPDPQLESPKNTEANSYQDSLQAVRQLARQDPKAVANVVRSWVGTDG